MCLGVRVGSVRVVVDCVLWFNSRVGGLHGLFALGTSR